MRLAAGAVAVTKRGSGALLAALMMGTAIAAGTLAVATVAYAQGAGQVSFSVPAGPLGQALTAYGRQAGLQVSYLAGIAAGRTSPGVSGALTRQEALARILAGTGLSYSFTNPTTVTVADRVSAAHDGAVDAAGATVLGTIDVTGAGGIEPDDAPYVTPGTSAHVSAEQIQRVAPSSTGDMLKGVPGVLSTGNRNGVALNVNIRGLQGQNRIRTSIDGAMQQSSAYRGYNGHDSRMYVDSEFIAGIDVQKGPGGSAGAMGGSVDMRTLNADDIIPDGQSIGVRMRGGVGGNRADPAGAINIFQSLRNPILQLGRTKDGRILSDENQFGSAVVAGRTDTVEVLAGISRRIAGNYFAGTRGEDMAVDGGTTIRQRSSVYGYGEEVHNTSEETDSLLLKARFRPADGHTLDLGYIYYASLYGEDSGDIYFIPGVPGSYRKSQAGLKHVRADTYTARYAWQPDSDLLDLRASLWATNVDSKGGGGYGLDTEVFTWGGELHNTSRWTLPIGDLKLRYGGDYYKEDIHSPADLGSAYRSNPNGVRSMLSGFVNAELLVMDKVRFDVGLRHDYYDVNDDGAGTGMAPRSGSKTNPSVGITLLPVEGIQLFAKYAEGWRPPSVREMTLDMPGLLTPNPDLRPEQSRNFEAGVNFSMNGLVQSHDRFRFKLAYFDNDYVDYIARAYVDGRRGFNNIPGMKLKGVEASGSYDMGVFFLDGSLNYYTSVEYCLSACLPEVGGDDYSSYNIPPKYSGTLAAGIRLLEQRLTLGGRITFAGDRAIPGAGTGFGAVLARYWNPYEVYDLFGSYTVSENLKLDFSLENLTDLYYLDALSDAKVPSPGRTFRFNMTATF